MSHAGLGTSRFLRLTRSGGAETRRGKSQAQSPRCALATGWAFSSFERRKVEKRAPCDHCEYDGHCCRNKPSPGNDCRHNEETTGGNSRPKHKSRRSVKRLLSDGGDRCHENGGEEQNANPKTVIVRSSFLEPFARHPSRDPDLNPRWHSSLPNVSDQPRGPSEDGVSDADGPS